MSVCALQSRKQASKQLKSTGKDFVVGFTNICTGALELRSKEPGVCWKSGGELAFASVIEFSGPNSTAEDAPLLFRICTNMYVPPAIHYHLRSPKVRQKLSFNINPRLADGPILEVTATPEEVKQLGNWVAQWLEDYFCAKPTAPPSPVPLISCEVGDNMQDHRHDLSTLGVEWRQRLYLWTPAALEAWKEFLAR